MSPTTSSKFGWGCLLALANIVVGAIIIYLGIALFMGSFSDAFGLVAFSIICTLGISLILWLPACYLVGFLPVWALRQLLRDPAESSDAHPADNPGHTAVPSEPKLSHDQLALVNYIKKARAKGLNQERIRQNLERNGWAAERIAWAVGFVTSQGGS